MSYYPNKRLEKKLRRQGFKYLAGLDEAGKGAWAGPLVAAAVILNPKIKIKGIKDSKLLRAPDRKQLFFEITKTAVAWSTAIINETKIDKIGISQANILAIKLALEKLSIRPDYLLIDALDINYHQLPTSAIIDGDYKITSIAAASIIAKVTRDQIMEELDEIHPQYGFKQHKGYGTDLHWQMIMKYGISHVHRKTWQPMKYFLND